MPNKGVAMRSSKKFLILIFLALAVSLLLPLSCRMAFWQGNLSVSIIHVQAKGTIYPAVNPVSFRIALTGPSTLTPTTITGTTTTIQVPVGTWDIAIEGLDDQGRLVARGSRSGLSVNPGSTTSATVVISATTAASGTIDVTVNWPASLVPGVTDWTISLGGTAKTSPLVTYVPPQVRYTETVPSGYYQLLVNLLNGAEVLAPVSVAVQVYDNLTTSAVIDLEARDFQSIPPAPTGLAATSGDGGIILSWTDVSRTETSYEVQRSDDGSAWTDLTPSAGLPSNTATYTDATADWGQSYHYRVGARNSWGTAYSAEAIGAWTALGSLSLTISIASPTDATITLDQVDDVILAPSSSLTVTVTEDFDSYGWAMDGIMLTQQTGKNLPIACSTLDLGVHHLVLFVTKNGLLYSKDLRFFIYN